MLPKYGEDSKNFKYMQNFICEGERIQFTIGSARISSGDGVVIGSKFAVSMTTGVENEIGVAQTEGVFELPKATGVISKGDAVFFDATNKNITKTGTGNTFAGYAYKPEISGATTVQVSICCDVKPQAAVQADSVATTAGGIVTDFNALLAKLKAAGLMANA